MLRILCTGGREVSPLFDAKEVMPLILSLNPDLVIVGDASGYDQLVEQAATGFCGVSKHCADWEQHGRAAGPIRNKSMVDLKPSLVLAFPGGRGTQNCVDTAMAAGIPVLYARTQKNRG